MIFVILKDICSVSGDLTFICFEKNATDKNVGPEITLILLFSK